VCRTASAQAPAEHQGDSQALQKQVDKLRQLVAKLSTRIGTLETQLGQQHSPNSAIAVDPASFTQPIPPSAPAPTAQQAESSADRSTLDFLRDTTINVAVDTYYDYNFNHPVGRVNLLRAYDVLSNNFSLNQADVILNALPISPPDAALARA
jgi:hypothetical protein